MITKTKEYVLFKDSKIIFKGTYNECLVKLHNIQGQSWEHALKYDGYLIRKDV